MREGIHFMGIRKMSAAMLKTKWLYSLCSAALTLNAEEFKLEKNE